MSVIGINATVVAARIAKRIGEREMNVLRKRVILLDGVSLYAVSRELQFDIDYRRLLQYFREQEGMLLRAYYFTTVDESAEFNTLRPLLDWLQYNGFEVRTKPQKVFTTAGGTQKIKGSMNVEIAVTAMQLVGMIDEIVLFSGDGDMSYLVEALKMSGMRVIVISTLKGAAPIVASELRRTADEFIDLDDLRQQVEDQGNRGAADNRRRRGDSTLHLKKE